MTDRIEALTPDTTERTGHGKTLRRANHRHGLVQTGGIRCLPRDHGGQEEAAYQLPPLEDGRRNWRETFSSRRKDSHPRLYRPQNISRVVPESKPAHRCPRTKSIRRTRRASNSNWRPDSRRTALSRLPIWLLRRIVSAEFYDLPAGQRTPVGEHQLSITADRPLHLDGHWIGEFSTNLFRESSGLNYQRNTGGLKHGNLQ